MAEHPYPRLLVGPTARSTFGQTTAEQQTSREPRGVRRAGLRFSRAGKRIAFSRANPARQTCCSTIAYIRSCWSVLHPMQGVKSIPASVWTDSSNPEEQECDTHARSLEKKALLLPWVPGSCAINLSKLFLYLLNPPPAPSF